MGYKCGNCDIDFPNKKAIAEHMLNVHNSPYIEGDEKLIQLCKDAIKKDNVKYANAKKAFEDAGEVV